MPSALEPYYTARFKKDVKAAKKRNFDLSLLADIIDKLCAREPLPPKNRDHALTNYPQYPLARECHIKPDWVLIYQIEEDALILVLARTGSHSDLDL